METLNSQRLLQLFDWLKFALQLVENWLVCDGLTVLDAFHFTGNALISLNARDNNFFELKLN